MKIEDEQQTEVEREPRVVTDSKIKLKASVRILEIVMRRDWGKRWQEFKARLERSGQSVTDFLDDGKQKHSIPVLDGARAIACLAIITFHMNLLARFHGIWNPALQGPGAFLSAALLFGESGVMLFFVLSGFLLFLPYARALLFGGRWPSLRRFYLRRHRLGRFLAIVDACCFALPGHAVLCQRYENDFRFGEDIAGNPERFFQRPAFRTDIQR